MTHAGYFEGIGGFTVGATRAQVETIYTCELDDFCNDWLNYILPNATHERDIITATGSYADIFTAGFPCQDISRANTKGKG
ncbi:DNA cytosine methyltransferase, partial [Pseudomonas aeruginosa]|nr:DNA cytosine methyltransferase [Pseudomonas aeruginosa]